MLLDGVLMWLHVLGAVGWLGSAMVFGMVVGPSLPGLSPATRSEFIVKVLPRYIRYSQAFAFFTVIVGVALALVIASGDMAVFAPTSPYGLYISTGAVLALATLVLALGVIIPSAKRVVRATTALAEKPGPPPPELMKYSKRLRVSSTAGMVLLIVVLVFMVAAGSV